MTLKKYWVLLFISSLTLSCSNNKGRYQDTRHLEIPPRMKIVKKSRRVNEENDTVNDKGLGDRVTLTRSENQPVIKIKKLFDRSWNMIEQALKLNNIKITDKNRARGLFYVNFDPDDQNKEKASLIDSMTFFLFTDHYEEAAYKLTVAWHDISTEVHVERIDQVNTDLLDDDEDQDNFSGSVDAGAKLLEQLYKTMRDDLPVN